MPDKQIHALSAFDCADLQKDYALALEKIAKLEERIRVADAEEPVGWSMLIDGERTQNFARDEYEKQLMLTIVKNHPEFTVTWETFYLHAQIPAEVELKEQLDTTPNQKER